MSYWPSGPYILFFTAHFVISQVYVVVASESDSQSRGCGFDFHHHVTTMDKLIAHMCLSPAV